MTISINFKSVMIYWNEFSAIYIVMKTTNTKQTYLTSFWSISYVHCTGDFQWTVLEPSFSSDQNLKFWMCSNLVEIGNIWKNYMVVNLDF